MTTIPAVDFDPDEPSLPPLTRRPDDPVVPEPVPRLRGARTALEKNPLCAHALDDEARSTITFGAVHPDHLRALTTVTDGVNLLTAKPVAGGTLYLTGPHRRYLDLQLLPDLINPRAGADELTAMDPKATRAPLSYVTHQGIDSTGALQPTAVLTIHMRDRRALAQAVYESMVATYEANSGRNVYTSSILQEGVKEPLTLFVLRVVYDDGTEDTYLIASDGNSRVISLWLARTGGDIHDAARACVATVIGSLDRKAPRGPSELRRARHEVQEMALRIRAGLQEEPLTEATRREGHTLTYPAVIVLGATDFTGAPMADLAAAREDLLSNLHTRVTPWSPTAQHNQGMRRVYRNALATGIVTDDEYEILTGAVGVGKLRTLVELPPHRLWASAIHQHILLASPRAVKMIGLMRQEFGFSRADRQAIGKRSGALILSPYRSDTIDQALRAFDNGGTLTDDVWKQPWDLTRGSDPVDVLDKILAGALAGDRARIAELTVLGGTAAILRGLITRDRGSKLGVKAAPLKTPYRAAPTRVLQYLSSTLGGRKMLHSIACSYVTINAVKGKAFHTHTAEIDGRTVADGDKVIDKANAQVSLQHEWDLAWHANPVLAEQTIATTRKELAEAGMDDDELPLAPHVKEQQRLDTSLTSATKAAHTLAQMSQTDPLGPDVFGSWEAVDGWQRRLDAMKGLLGYGPKAPLKPFDDAMTAFLSGAGEDGEND